MWKLAGSVSGFHPEAFCYTKTYAPVVILVLHNEPEEKHRYHCDALGSFFPDSVKQNVPRDGVPREEAKDADGIVLTGSTAGVYERAERTWIGELESLVIDILEEDVPTLGVCFGHQLINSALGGDVEKFEDRHELVELSLEDDPLFEGVGPVGVALHGDRVTEAGKGMEVLGSSGYNDVFTTRHRDAPVWTVQFHPEVTEDLVPTIEKKYGWTETEHSFEDLNAHRVFENFRTLVESHAGSQGGEP